MAGGVGVAAVIIIGLIILGVIAAAMAAAVGVVGRGRFDAVQRRLRAALPAEDGGHQACRLRQQRERKAASGKIGNSQNSD